MRSVRLRNFRSFVDTGRIELKPLTVLVGANGSGKSSFLRFFPLLRQTLEARTESPLLWYSDTGYVDFGDFDHAIYQKADPRRIMIDFELIPLLQKQAANAAPASLSMTIEKRNSETQLSQYAFSWEDHSAVVALAPNDQPMTYTIDGRDILPLGTDWVASSEHGPVRSFFPSNHTLKSWKSLIGTDEKVDLSTELYEALNENIDVHYRPYTRGIVYLGPFRSEPQRFYRYQELDTGQLDPRGENLAMFLRSLNDEQRRELSAFIREHLGFGVRIAYEGSHLVVLIEEEGGRTFNLIDMGFGFSQVLPVVAQCWATKSRGKVSERNPPTTMLAIEQPELHLHPMHQAKLADLFVSVLRASQAAPEPALLQLLIETHSEALVSRLGELVELGKILPDDISVLLFEKDPSTGTSSIQHAYFNADGTLANWPIGFFAH